MKIFISLFNLIYNIRYIDIGYLYIHNIQCFILSLYFPYLLCNAHFYFFICKGGNYIILATLILLDEELTYLCLNLLIDKAELTSSAKHSLDLMN